MKKLLFSIALCGIAFVSISAIKSATNSTLTANFIEGNPQIESINALSFGPEGILFIGDSKNAAIYALDTKDTASKDKSDNINIGDFDTKIAAALGTTSDNIRITDMAVNPVSKTVYFSVNVTDGTPVLLKLNGETLENVSLTDASYSKIELNGAIAVDAEDRRGRSQRVWAISDMMYHDGKVMVSGLSNKEFGSTFRSIPFPFTDAQEQASLEIFHVAHGRYETNSPIKAFNIINIENKDYLMASYTCTPLVLFPIETLNSGKHIKGRTIAELGWGNSPLDIISFKKGDESYYLMANSNRQVMRLDAKDIASSKEDLTEQAGVVGVPFLALPMVNVVQLSNLDSENVVYLQRTSGGDLVLRTRPTSRI